MESKLTPSLKYELHRYLRMHVTSMMDAFEIANDFMYLHSVYGEDLYNEIVKEIESTEI